MKPCAEHPSLRFKQRAVIVFLTAEGVFQSKFTKVCNWFTVMTVLTRALCVVVGPTGCKNDKSCSLICVTKSGQPVTTTSKIFTGNGFMNWLKKIGGPLGQKLLSKVSYHKNVCVTLFIFVDIGRFMHDGLSPAHGGFAKFWIQVTLTNISSVKCCIMNNTQHLSITSVSTQVWHEWRLKYHIVRKCTSTDW